MMNSGESLYEFVSPTSGLLSSDHLIESHDEDSDLKISTFLTESPELSQYTVLSPTISRLDHQEVVETADFMNSTGASSLSNESTDLFSFELESNGIPRDLNIFPDMSSEIDWFDLIDTTGASGDLDDIQLSPVPHDRSEILPIQPKVTTSQAIPSIHKGSPTISCPTPSRIFASNNDVRRGRKSIPPTNMKKSGKQYGFDEEGSEDGETSDYEVDRFLAIRPRASSRMYSESCLHNEDLVNGRPGQRLQLSAEENKLLQAMGVRMPSRFPLSRTEERALRTVRRKIRNKLSAQASRARRQEYLTDLECRVRLTDKENQRLRRQIVHLQNDKRDLIAHLRRLRSYVSKFLYKDDSHTPLPLFARSNTKGRLATSAAHAAGGTSLLVVTFMILGWTALMPPSPAKSGSAPVVTGSQSSGFLSFFPGRSRSLLESRPSDDQIAPISKVTASADNTEERVVQVAKVVLESPEIQKIVEKMDRVRLEESVKEPQELSDIPPLGNHSDHAEHIANDDELFDPVIEKDPSKPSEFSIASNVMNFQSSLDL